MSVERKTSSSTTAATHRSTPPILPFMDVPVGVLSYDGHEIDVWAIATTIEGKVLYLNVAATDTAISATLKQLLRRNGGKATFQPTKGLCWSGPSELRKLDEHYETIVSALTHKGLRLKNYCVLPDSAHIGAGLSRPMEILLGIDGSSQEDTETVEEAEEETVSPAGGEAGDTSAAETKPIISSFRYVLGDVLSERPPMGALFAHLTPIGVVCHPDWEAVLWEHGMKRGLLLPQLALGLRVWSITRAKKTWTDLVGELWRAGVLVRPAPPVLGRRVGSRPHREHPTR